MNIVMNICYIKGGRWGIFAGFSRIVLHGVSELWPTRVHACLMYQCLCLWKSGIFSPEEKCWLLRPRRVPYWLADPLSWVSRPTVRHLCSRELVITWPVHG